MPTRNILRAAGTGRLRTYPEAIGIQFDQDANKLKFTDNEGDVHSIVDEDSEQTLTGKTITGAISTLSVETVAAAGSTQADAGQIAATTNALIEATGADATKGVKLPAALAGRFLLVKNNANAVLKVWPTTGDGINAIAVDSNIALAAFTSAIFAAKDGTTWFTIPLLPS
jgi:hypothetical protein